MKGCLGLLAAFVTLWGSSTPVATELQKKFKEEVFELLKPVILDYFDKNRLIDGSKDVPPRPTAFYTFLPPVVEIPETATAEQHTHPFQRVQPAAGQLPEKITDVFRLRFILSPDSTDLRIEFDNRVVFGYKVIQYVLPLDKPFAQASLRRTTLQFLDRLDQTIHHFGDFLADLSAFQQLYNAKDAGKAPFQVDALHLSVGLGGPGPTGLTHFDVDKELTRLAAKDDYNNKLFAEQAAISTQIKPPDDLADQMKGVYDPKTAEFAVLVLKPSNPAYVQFGAVEALVFFHRHRQVITIVYRSNYFSWESDFNIMTRGFVLESLEFTLTRIEQEVFANLLALQASQSAEGSLNAAWDAALASGFAKAEESKQFWADWECRSSTGFGMSLCRRKANDDNSWSFRGVYAGVTNQEAKFGGEGAGGKDTAKDSTSTVTVNGKEVVPESLPFGVYYIERKFPLNSQYDFRVFLQQAVRDLQMLGDGHYPTPTKDTPKEGAGGVQPNYRELRFLTYLDSPKCISPFSGLKVDGSTVLASSADKADFRYYLNYNFGPDGLGLEWKKSPAGGKSLLSSVAPWADLDRSKSATKQPQTKPQEGVSEKQVEALKEQTGGGNQRRLTQVSDGSEPARVVVLNLPSSTPEEGAALLKRYKPVI